MCAAITQDYVQAAGGWANVNLAELNTYLNTIGASKSCPAVSGPPAGTAPSPETLARQAMKTITFPAPSGHRSPSESQLYAGIPFTWVNLWTFYWTDPATWHSLSATAAVGGVSATVTAVPMRLSFDPGNGTPAVICDGPGRAWDTSDGNGPPTGGACAYQYSMASSGALITTQTITWKITWVGSGGASGVLPDITTSTPGQLRVMQVQVVTR